MGINAGVLAAVLSAAFGGTAIGATRYLAGTLDPATIGALRFDGGFLILLAVALWRGETWPRGTDRGPAAALGVLFFAVFPILFNAALIYTTAARGALALSTVPLLTIAVGAGLRIERPTARKTIGVAIAMAGVVYALGAGSTHAPPGAWRGDLLMVGAALCMALYNVWSRPFLARSGPLAFSAWGMGCGAACLTVVALWTGGHADLRELGPAGWLAAAYLTVICGALMFFLWAYALGRTPPTVVSVSVCVNPVVASMFGLVLLDEPVGANLVLGLVAVLVGIAIAAGALWPGRSGAPDGGMPSSGGARR